MNGKRTAVYQTSNGNKQEIVDEWKDNVLVFRKVDGNPAYIPNGNKLFWGRRGY